MMMKIEILRGTLPLFYTYGVKALSMDDISRLLGVSKKVLIRHFANKETLLKECVKYKMNQEEVFKYADDSLLDMLLNYAEAYPGLYQKINRCCYLDVKKYYHEVYRYFMEHLNNHIAACQKKLDEGIANGYISKKTSPGLVYSFLQEHFLRLFFDNNMSVENTRWITELILTFARGISTVKGRAYIDNKLKKRTYNEAY